MAPARPPAAAIVGIGATEFSKDSGRSELRLAAEAVRAALDDAGVRAADVQGLVTFTMAAEPHARPSTTPRWQSPPARPTWWSATGR